MGAAKDGDGYSLTAYLGNYITGRFLMACACSIIVIIRPVLIPRIFILAHKRIISEIWI